MVTDKVGIPLDPQEMVDGLIDKLNAYFRPTKRVREGYSVCPSAEHGGSRTGANCQWLVTDMGEVWCRCWSRQCSPQSILDGVLVQFPEYREFLDIKQRGHVVTRPEVDEAVPKYVKAAFDTRFNCVGEGYLIEHRYENKSFSWERPGGTGATPYLTRFCAKGEHISKREPIILVEGPKTALWLAKCGYQAATWPGGSGKAKDANYIDLEGADLVICWSDDDEAGRKAMEEGGWKAQVFGAKEVRILDWAEGETSNDAADYDENHIFHILEESSWHAPISDTLPVHTDLALSLILQNQYGIAIVEDMHQDTSVLPSPHGLMYYTKQGLLRDARSGWATVRVSALLDAQVASLGVDIGELSLQSNTLEMSIKYEELTKAQEKEKRDQMSSLDNQVVTLRKRQESLTKLKSLKEFKEVYQNIGGALRYLEDRRKMPPEMPITKKADIDTTPGYIGTEDGVLNLEKLELEVPMDARRLLVSKSVTCGYWPRPEAGVIDRLFETMENWQRKMLLQFLWMALGGYRPKNFLVWTSPGGGGKSTLVRAVLQLFGEYGGPVSAGVLVARRDENDATPGLEMLRGKRLAVIQEAGDKLVNSERLKLMTGGLDYDVSRGMRENFTVSDTVAALWFVGNSAPLLDWEDRAVRERLLIMETPGREAGDTDPSIADIFKQTPPREVLERLLHLILTEGPVDPKLPMHQPEEMLALQASERELNTPPLVLWITEHYIRDDQAWVTSDELWRAWKGEMGDYGEEDNSTRVQGVTQNLLGRTVRRLFDGSLPMARHQPGQGSKVRGFPIRRLGAPE